MHQRKASSVAGQGGKGAPAAKKPKQEVRRDKGSRSILNQSQMKNLKRMLLSLKVVPILNDGVTLEQVLACKTSVDAAKLLNKGGMEVFGGPALAGQISTFDVMWSDVKDDAARQFAICTKLERKFGRSLDSFSAASSSAAQPEGEGGEGEEGEGEEGEKEETSEEEDDQTGALARKREEFRSKLETYMKPIVCEFLEDEQEPAFTQKWGRVVDAVMDKLSATEGLEWDVIEPEAALQSLGTTGAKEVLAAGCLSGSRIFTRLCESK